MKNGATYFKWSVLLICFLVGAFLFRGCNCGREKIKEVPVITIDTVWMKSDSVISYVPQPYKVLVPYKVSIPKDNDSILLEQAIRDGIITSKDDTISILREYLTTRYYDTTFKVQYGTVRIRDTVSTNKFIGRSVATSFKIPVVIKTMTIEAQKRNVLLFGLGFLGNKISPLYGTEISLDLKNKNDRVYEVSALLLKSGDLYYKAEVKFPIRLKR